MVEEPAFRNGPWQDAILSRVDYLSAAFSLAAREDSPLVVKIIDSKDLDAWRKMTPESQVNLFDLRLQGQKTVQGIFSGVSEKVH